MDGQSKPPHPESQTHIMPTHIQLLKHTHIQRHTCTQTLSARVGGDSPIL